MLSYQFDSDIQLQVLAGIIWVARLIATEYLILYAKCISQMHSCDDDVMLLNTK